MKILISTILILVSANALGGELRNSNEIGRTVFNKINETRWPDAEMNIFGPGDDSGMRDSVQNWLTRMEPMKAFYENNCSPDTSKQGEYKCVLIISLGGDKPTQKIIFREYSVRLDIGTGEVLTNRFYLQGHISVE